MAARERPKQWVSKRSKYDAYRIDGERRLAPDEVREFITAVHSARNPRPSPEALYRRKGLKLWRAAIESRQAKR